jgi:hypothetical protein
MTADGAVTSLVSTSATALVAAITVAAVASERKVWPHDPLP